MTDAVPPRDALKGWKSIADFFGRDPSTVMRWAAQRGLPVRRLPGAGRSSVYAVPAELAAWLESDRGDPAAEEPAPASAEPPPTTAVAAEPVPIAPPSRRRRAMLVAGATAVVAAVAAVAAWHRPDAAATAPAFRDEAIERAYLAASYDRDLRTPASLARARDEFGAIIARDPTAAVAYSGLSETFLLLREYSAFPSAEAYRKAAAAARAAIALAPDLVAAHRALAFVAFWSDHDIHTARHEFARARDLDPRSAQTWHWYATALSANGEPAAALVAIAEARRLASDSTPIAADYGLIAYLAGRRDEGLAALRKVATESPGEISSHWYLADLALVRGEGTTYLAEMATACRLKRDDAGSAALDGEAAAFAAHGKAGLLVVLAARAERALTPTAGHYDLARIEALQGRAADAVAQLRSAAAANEPGIAALPGDIAFAGLADDPAFAAMRRRESLSSDSIRLPRL